MNPEKDVETLVGARSDIRIERILCPVDPSDVSAMAYRYAQSIAAHYHASLIVQKVIEYSQYVSVSYTPSMPAFVEFSESLVADGLAALHRFVDGSGGTIQPECIVQANFSAADAILSLAETRAISLIIMGTHGRRGFDRLMMGSVTERVLRHASCPVLAVRPATPGSNYPGAPDEPVPIRRILCCVDFSAHSRRALEYALSAADAYSADVTVLHVLDPVSQSADVAQETDAAMANLAKLLPPGSSSTKTHLEVRLGEAYREILLLGSEMQADLVVTGVRGRNSLDLAVFGSTTYRLIQLGPGPVLTVPV
jgi:nucleotide-binding universal stress UspA family protein